MDPRLSYADVWPEDRKPRLKLGPDELWFLKELDILHKLPRPIIIFCADNFDPYRSWPVQHYERLALHAKRRGASIIEVGVQAKLGVGTDFVNATTIRGTAALLSICDLFVGNSSGPLHFAQAGGTPCLAFFSLALPERFIHDDSLVSVVQSKDLDCIDCMTTNYVERNQKGCRSQPLAACMQELPYERGKEALDEIFDEYLADCPGPGEEGSLARTFRARVTTQQAARLLERGHVERAARFLGFAQERLGGVRDREAKV